MAPLSLDIGVGDMPKGTVNIDVLQNPKANIRADAQYLPFRDSTFDKIYCMSVLEHLNNPFLAVREIRRVLKLRAKAEFDFPRKVFSHSLMSELLAIIFNPHYWFILKGKPFRELATRISDVKARGPRYTHLWIISSDVIARFLRIEKEYLDFPVFPKPLRAFKRQIFKERHGFMRVNVHVDAVKDFS